MSGVVELTFECEKKFLHALIDEGIGDESGHSGNFLFRGQADFRWGLVPSVYRDSGTDFLNKFWRARRGRFSNKAAINIEPYHESIVRRLAEILLVSDFYLRCEKLGLSVPSLSDKAYHYLQSLQHDVDEVSKLSSFEWPHESLLPAFSFAQHNNLPTRLLDWSRDARTASFFAAWSSENCGEDQSEFITVWRCIGREVDAGNWFLQKVRTSNQDLKFGQRLVFSPHITNKNLNSQSGVLTQTYQDLGKIITLDTVLGKVGQVVNRRRDLLIPESDLLTNKYQTFSLVKYNLITSKASNLLIELRKLGVSYSSLFRSPAGCLQEIVDFIEFPSPLS